MTAVTLRCFEPFISRRSRVLILGSMPGPEALRKGEYYGFNGNHFWFIIPALFREPQPSTYAEKLDLVRRHHIALWDTLATCVRAGALDSAIRDAQPTNIPELLKKYPNIRAIFINGKYAHGTFEKYWGQIVDRPYFYLPSTSPAHATLSLAQKTRKWSAIKKFLS